MDGSGFAARYVNMDEGLIRLALMIGTPLSLASGLTSFLITYEGYIGGQNLDKKLAFRIALQNVLVALAVFAVISITVGFVLARVFAQ